MCYPIFFPAIPPCVDHVVNRLPLATRVRSTNTLGGEVPLSEVARLQRDVGRAERPLPQVFETVMEVAALDGVKAGVRPARERPPHDAQAVHLVEHRDREAVLPSAEADRVVADGPRPHPLRLRLRARQRVPRALLDHHPHVPPRDGEVRRVVLPDVRCGVTVSGEARNANRSRTYSTCRRRG